LHIETNFNMEGNDIQNMGGSRKMNFQKNDKYEPKGGNGKSDRGLKNHSACHPGFNIY
jgi:hypothetical protein